jgi:nitrite reductase/ring-hydroxylating ferredoxin subunit
MSSTRPAPLIEKPNRREFLYYLGGASLVLLGAGSIGVLARFLNPPLHEGIESGIFQVDLANIARTKEWPISVPNGHYWLANIGGGLLALDGHCSFRRATNNEGAFYKWVLSNNRFECPVCGSKYRLDGTRIEGPSQRGLDRFLLEVTSPNGILTTPPDGSPVSIKGATKIVVDTNRLIYGQSRPRWS